MVPRRLATVQAAIMALVTWVVCGIAISQVQAASIRPAGSARGWQDAEAERGAGRGVFLWDRAFARSAESGVCCAKSRCEGQETAEVPPTQGGPGRRRSSWPERQRFEADLQKIEADIHASTVSGQEAAKQVQALVNGTEAARPTAMATDGAWEALISGPDPVEESGFLREALRAARTIPSSGPRPPNGQEGQMMTAEQRLACYRLRWRCCRATWAFQREATCRDRAIRTRTRRRPRLRKYRWEPRCHPALVLRLFLDPHRIPRSRRRRLGCQASQ